MEVEEEGQRVAKADAKTSAIGNTQNRRRRRKHNTRAKAAQRDAKWTVEDDATIVRMIDEGSTYDKIASKLGKDLKRMDIINRWTRYIVWHHQASCAKRDKKLHYLDCG